MTQFHRHLRANSWLTMEESVKLMAEHGPLWTTQGPFKYCEICKCVPTTFTGITPEDGSGEANE